MGKRILIVDDYREGATTMQTVFTMLGHEVEVAFAGQACLDRLAAPPPIDVIFLDIDMPKMSGAQVIRTLMEQVPFPTVKVIALTAWGEGWESDWGPPGWCDDARYRRLVVGSYDKGRAGTIEALRKYLDELPL